MKVKYTAHKKRSKFPFCIEWEEVAVGGGVLSKCQWAEDRLEIAFIVQRVINCLGFVRWITDERIMIKLMRGRIK